MKTLVLCALVAAMALDLGGCAVMSAEDRDFYGRGWIHPKDLDDDAPLRAKPSRTGTAAGPAVTEPASTAPAGGTTLQDEDGGAPFLTPQPGR